MRRLPAPATLYKRFVPLTRQFVTATPNSLRSQLLVCKSAAQVQRILRTCVVGTGTPLMSRTEEKSSCTFQLSGDTPPANIAAAGLHDSVPAPCTVPYTPIRFPLDPGTP